jgi:hypothetical protein
MPYKDPTGHRDWKRRHRAEKRLSPEYLERVAAREELRKTASKRHVARHAEARRKNPEVFRDRLRAWRSENRERFLENNRRWVRERYRSNIDFRLRKILRERMRGAVRRESKCASATALLGCTTSELRAHLEAQFRPGMTWENYGPVWHIDHIRPCASFDLLDPAQQRACFHYTNLQPLFALENMKKGSTWRS